MKDRADPPFDTLMTEAEVAQKLNLAIGTLQTWRSCAKGPAFVRLGRAVRYRHEDVARFVREGLSLPARGGVDA